MDRIQPCLWLNNEAEQAARFYASVFKNSSVGKAVHYGPAASEASGQEEGSVMTLEFELEGLKFLALNGGPHFKIDPSISFFIGCESANEIDSLWEKLQSKTRMELQKYPFAEKYGWCEDRFGVNWQLILGPKRRQKITPALLFANALYGKAGEAIRFYVEQFPNSKVQMVAHDEKTKAVLHSVVTLANSDFVLMEGPLEHEFEFSPAVSFIVNCDSQSEIDQIWSRLSAVPDAEQCGWLKDRFGLSWQVVPKDWGKWIANSNPSGRERLMEAILKMKKPDLAKLERALS